MKLVPKIQQLLMIAALCGGAIATQTGCDGGGGFSIPESKLKAGGVFIAYVNGCEGCTELSRGDLIQSVDGKKVSTGIELDATNYMDGQQHTLSIIRYKDGSTGNVNITASPTELPPLKGVPPFWTTGAEGLNKAPSWARRRLFGHAIPSIMLYSSDGGLVTGRDLYGKKRFIVFFDWQTRDEQAIAQTYLQVMQKAKSDLEAAGYDVMFGQLKFPGRDRPPMNDTDLRDFVSQAQVTVKDGGPLPLPRTYRYPNNMEYSPANDIGLEGSTTLIEYLGSSPAILIVDERGIVQWHSEGKSTDPEQKLPDDVYTAIAAVKHALGAK